MKVIIGLGNPGSQYQRTRHNVGFMFLDFLATKFSFGDFTEKPKLKSFISEGVLNGEKCLLVKPTTYMNLSGEAVVAIKNFYKLENEDILVCFDDVDLLFDEVRFRSKGSAGTHNGMRSILGLLGTEELVRLKFGIDSDLRQGALSDFVLGRFTDEEFSELPKVFKKALAKVPFLT
jgi:PTH1 family peptidyl-tRNA hydrolase